MTHHTTTMANKLISGISENHLLHFYVYKATISEKLQHQRLRRIVLGMCGKITKNGVGKQKLPEFQRTTSLESIFQLNHGTAN